MIEKQINSNEGSVDLSSLKSGIYVVHVFDGDHLIKEKIIIELVLNGSINH